MKIFKCKTELYLHDTSVENLFINEYMIPANGDFVKVYLFAKMYLDRDLVIFNETLAKYLNMPVQQVLAAWDYWESKKVIRKHYTGKDPDDFDVEFICLKQLMYKGDYGETVKEEEKTAAKINSSVFSQELLELYSKIERVAGKTLNSKELHDIKLWFEDWGMDDKVILKAYEICVKDRKKKAENSYISAIIREWYEKGLFNMNSLEDHLFENDKKHNTYKRIFKALGFFRNPTEEEKRIMDIWLDEYMLDVSVILEACKKTSGISNPNINYIHSILKDWKDEEHPSRSVKTKLTAAQIDKLYEDIRAENRSISEARRKEIYSAFPRIRFIDEELRELNPKRLKLVLEGKTNTSIYKSIEKEMTDLRNEKISTLKNAGYPADYLNPVYTCPRCKDTGFLDNGEKCVCLTQRLMNK
ncbi:MAG: DnaD domain protein [Firmicutes bacterium]|nr:DnaD domain protein [Bacillota bacterium]